MALTLKEWFDGLSPAGQLYVKQQCKWIDTSTPDYYAHIKLDKHTLKAQLDKYSDGSRMHTAMLLSIAKAYSSDFDIPDEYINCKLKEFVKYDERVMIYFDSKTQQKVIYDVYVKNKEYIQLKFLLHGTEDFSKIEWDKLEIEYRGLRSDLREIIDSKSLKQLVLNDPRIFCLNKNKVNDDLFDDVFFCENGWTEEQKISFLKTSYHDCMTDVEDFMKRIVTVDESYLKYITIFTDRRTAIATEVYNEKKPENELTGNEPIAMKFRYPVHIRKLFRIAACCFRGNVGKAMAGNLGIVSGILRICHYDFNTVFYYMYPQYAPVKVLTTDTQEQE